MMEIELVLKQRATKNEIKTILKSFKKVGKLRIARDSTYTDDERNVETRSIMFSKSQTDSLVFLGVITHLNEKKQHVDINIEEESVDASMGLISSEKCLANASDFTELFKIIVRALDSKIECAIGDVSAVFHGYLYPNYADLTDYVSTKAPELWLTYYGALLTSKIGSEILLKIPAYKTELVGSGVLVFIAPLSLATMPKERNPYDKIHEELYEIQNSASARIAEISAYFKEHGILEKLREKKQND